MSGKNVIIRRRLRLTRAPSSIEMRNVDARNERALSLCHDARALGELIVQAAENASAGLGDHPRSDTSVYLRLIGELRSTLKDCFEKRGGTLVGNLDRFSAALNSADARRRDDVPSTDSEEGEETFEVPSAAAYGKNGEDGKTGNPMLGRYLTEQAEIAATSPKKDVVSIREPEAILRKGSGVSATSASLSIPSSERSAGTSKRLCPEEGRGKRNTSQDTLMDVSSQELNEIHDDWNGDSGPVAEGGGANEETPVERESNDEDDENKDLHIQVLGMLTDSEEDSESAVDEEVSKPGTGGRKKRLVKKHVEGNATKRKDSGVSSEQLEMAVASDADTEIPPSSSDADVAQEPEPNANESAYSGNTDVPVEPGSKPGDSNYSGSTEALGKSPDVSRKSGYSGSTEISNESKSSGYSGSTEVVERISGQDSVSGYSGSAVVNRSEDDDEPKQNGVEEGKGAKGTEKTAEEDSDDALHAEVLKGLAELDQSDDERLQAPKRRKSRRVSSDSSDAETIDQPRRKPHALIRKAVVLVSRCDPVIPPGGAEPRVKICAVKLTKLPAVVAHELEKKGAVPTSKFGSVLGLRAGKRQKGSSEDEEDAEIRRLTRPLNLRSGRKVTVQEVFSSAEDSSASEEAEPNPKRVANRRKAKPKKPDDSDSSSDADSDADAESEDSEEDGGKSSSPIRLRDAESDESDDARHEDVMDALADLDSCDEENRGGDSDSSSDSDAGVRKKPKEKADDNGRIRPERLPSDSGDDSNSNKENISNGSESSDAEGKISEKKTKSDTAKKIDALIARVRFEDSSSSSDSDTFLTSSVSNREKRRKSELELLREKRKRSRSLSGRKSDEVSSSDSSGSQESLSLNKRKKRKKTEGKEREEEEEDATDGEEAEVVELSDSDFEDTKAKKPPPKKRKRARVISSSSDSEVDGAGFEVAVEEEDGEPEDESQNSQSPMKGRKNIKKIIKEKNLSKDTQDVMREEKERAKRLDEKKKALEEIVTLSSDEECEAESKKDSAPKKFILDFVKETKEPTVVVNRILNRELKPHQREGIQFMFDATVESLSQFKQGNAGGGAILAHCMGLGKTFQVITLVHTLITHPEFDLKRFLILCPKNTVLNWRSEFRKWLDNKGIGSRVDVYKLDDKQTRTDARHAAIRHWFRSGGVFIMSYSEFRPLANKNNKKISKFAARLQEYLVDPGPDFVICDEGHLLKNENSAIFKALAPVKTKRRIILTGTPLQNNLKEYHSMVQIVKPNLLGTLRDFLNRFVNPINNGSMIDSTPSDVALMRKRSFVLHRKLERIVQRRAYVVLRPYLPEKFEYAIKIKMSPLQETLYKSYLDQIAIEGGIGGKGTGNRQRMLQDFHVFTRVWNHPAMLTLHSSASGGAKSESEDSMKDFVVDDDSESSEEGGDAGKNGVKKGKKGGDDDEESDDDDDDVCQLWWKDCVKDVELNNAEHSGKFMVFFDILMLCQSLGEKLVVFSSSLKTLDLIAILLKDVDQRRREAMKAGQKMPASKEDFFASGKPKRWDNYVVEMGPWMHKRDYYRIDGKTSKDDRDAIIKVFNRPTSNARLLLVSTKAGGIGVNLVGANRAVIFDVNWNPANDVQALYRIYRLGQDKKVFVYRLVAGGCMEDKIYSRCVSKLSLSSRVVDDHQIKRHYSSHDLHELYVFDPPPSLADTQELPVMPKDRLLANLLHERKEWIIGYHDHDSLLEDRPEDALDEEEKKKAWDEYESEGKPVQLPQGALLSGISTLSLHPGMSKEAVRSIVNLFVQGFKADAQTVAIINAAFNDARLRSPSADALALKEFTVDIIFQFCSRMAAEVPPAPVAGPSQSLPAVRTYPHFNATAAGMRQSYPASRAYAAYSGAGPSNGGTRPVRMPNLPPGPRVTSARPPTSLPLRAPSRPVPAAPNVVNLEP